MSFAGGCMSKGSILHEFMHALGFPHAHTAPDRGECVTVNLDNVQSGKGHNFNKITRGLELSNCYDYSSVMHYSEYAFSISRSKQTIDCRGNSCGQRGGVPSKDRDDINSLYPTNTATRTPTPRQNPTPNPTRFPTRLPTRNPTRFPTRDPTATPTTTGSGPNWTCRLSGYGIFDWCSCEFGVADPDCTKPRQDSNDRLFCVNLLVDASEFATRRTFAKQS